MRDLPLRRVLIVLLLYGIGAWLSLPALDGLQRLLLLPALFGRLARVALLLGIPLAVAIAWRYPDMGGGEDS